MKKVGWAFTSLMIVSLVFVMFTSITLATPEASASGITPTKTVVIPNPSIVIIGKTITFVGKVIDTSATPTVPAGHISWNDNSAGGTFTVNNITTNKCNLSSISSKASTCKITYTPSSTITVGGTIIKINATYSGDITHKISSGASKLTVLRKTFTTISPIFTSVLQGETHLYKTTVADITNSGTKTAPNGTVSWKASVSGGSFTSSTCTLTPISSSKSSCQVTYTAPFAAGNDTITGSYGGDGTHGKSFGKATLAINTLVSMTLSPGSCINGSPCFFNPENVTIPVGNTVTWKNIDTFSIHVPTSDQSLFSQVVQPGQTYSFKFTSPGTITYHCAIHPFMVGVINVR